MDARKIYAQRRLQLQSSQSSLASTFAAKLNLGRWFDPKAGSRRKLQCHSEAWAARGYNLGHHLPCRDCFASSSLSSSLFAAVCCRLALLGSFRSSSAMAGGPYSGTSTLALVARISAVSLGVVYGSIKLGYLKARAPAPAKH